MVGLPSQYTTSLIPFYSIVYGGLEYTFCTEGPLRTLACAGRLDGHAVLPVREGHILTSAGPPYTVTAMHPGP